MLSLQRVDDTKTQWLGELLQRYRHCFFEAYNKKVEGICKKGTLVQNVHANSDKTIDTFVHAYTILYMRAFIHATYIRTYVSMSMYSLCIAGIAQSV
jgi:hypothetical protein